MSRPVLDVSHLKDSAFGHKGLIWWGTAGYMVIEGTMFLIVFVAYFYLRLRESMWPPSLPNPDAVMPTVNLLVMAVSLIPAHFAKRAAERCDITGVRPWLLALTIFSAAIVALRALEYTDVVENSVLLAVSYRKPPTRKRFVDFAENSLYWYFIVASFVPVYLTVYWAPRWL
jgi:heme/copper-type cytochrome/quinol oxidase subunit 3